MTTRALFLGPVDRVLSLRTLPALEALVPTELAAIAQHAKEEFFPAGSVLLRAGELADSFYIVVDGSVSLTRDATVVRQIGSGDEVGLLQVLSRSPSTVQARAVSDTLALRLDWDAHLDVWEEHAPVLLDYLRYLARRSVEAIVARAGHVQLEGWETQPPPPPPELSLVERLLAVRAADLLPTDAVDALVELAHHVTELQLESGTTLWHPGDAAEYFVLIVSGGLRATAESGGAVRAGPGAVAGLDEALAGQARWSAAVAERHTRLLRIDVTALVDILEDHFDLAIEFISLLARRLLRLETGDT